MGKGMYIIKIKIKYVSNNIGYLIVKGCHKGIKRTHNHGHSQVKVACLSRLSKKIWTVNAVK